MAPAPQHEHPALLLSAILELSDDAVISQQLDHTITGWNQGAERLFGYTAEEMIGQSFLTLIPEELLSDELAGLARVAAGEHLGHFETTRRRKDGSLVEVSTTVTPVRGARGNLTEWIRVARDISERKRADRAALLVSAIVDSSDDAIISKDLEGNVTSWNPSAERIFGYTSAEIIGKSILTIIPPDRLDEEPAILDRLRRGERVDHFETIRKRKDGVLVPVSVTASPVKDAEGRIIGASKIVQDITEQKKMEADLRRANEDLEQFALSAAHDLKEPLRSQKVFAEMLAARCAEKLGETELEMLHHLQAGVARMETLVADLLSYARTVQSEEPAALVDAAEALAAALNNLAASVAESRAQVTSDALPVLRFHRTHLQQLFQNLIGNAIKYRRQDLHPEIHISARRDGDLWVLSIRDNGIGIEPQNRERVFRPFSRLHTQERYSGSGIGLTLCQRIIERNGGRIWVESEPGQGSTFFFTGAP